MSSPQCRGEQCAVPEVSISSPSQEDSALTGQGSHLSELWGRGPATSAGGGAAWVRCPRRACPRRPSGPGVRREVSESGTCPRALRVSRRALPEARGGQAPGRDGSLVLQRGFPWAKWQWLAEVAQPQTLTGDRGGGRGASVPLPSALVRSLSVVLGSSDVEGSPGTCSRLCPAGARISALPLPSPYRGPGGCRGTWVHWAEGRALADRPTQEGAAPHVQVCGLSPRRPGLPRPGRGQGPRVRPEAGHFPWRPSGTPCVSHPGSKVVPRWSEHSPWLGGDCPHTQQFVSPQVVKLENRAPGRHRHGGREPLVPTAALPGYLPEPRRLSMVTHTQPRPQRPRGLSE